ncbi:TIR domain-containing protein [Malacoplasma iowae]|uniref:TIR domain-containing protein n=1 Tax=Malacoplasma iowae TaxID=2116 RepID=UPI00022C64D6|nr:TIR domain-containing protein [Malacoplasma iowae]EGZ31764.1 hypothetical protein GUU_00717 [Malacoplasma iowae 695]WPL40086.1 TIR domain-containing protein [Malacoplasma iowae]
MEKITCFLSYSHDYRNEHSKNEVKKSVLLRDEIINYSENEDKSMFSDETIWNYLHDRISGSSCTILLLTWDLLNDNKEKISYTKGSFLKSGWIYNEISASLRDWKNNRVNGLICVMCDNLRLVDSNAQYQIPEILNQNRDYIVWADYSEFIKNPNRFIMESLKKRDEQIKCKKYNIVYDLHN